MLDNIFIVLVVGVTIALLFWVLYAGKKAGFQRNGVNAITVKSRQPIGRSEQIVVFYHRDQEYVIGVTSHSISLIDKSVAPVDAASNAA